MPALMEGAKRLEVYAELVDQHLRGRVLDIGCRTMDLAEHVPGHYVGVDIMGSPPVLSNLGDGLPFRDRTFDAVLAVDVLEHVDDIHGAFAEAARVTAGALVVALPNVFVWHYRLRVLAGRQPSGKYGLPADPPSDRHRWILTYAEAVDFVHRQAEVNELVVADEGPGFFTYSRLVPRAAVTLGRKLGPRSAALLASRYWAVLRRPG